MIKIFKPIAFAAFAVLMIIPMVVAATENETAVEKVFTAVENDPASIINNYLQAIGGIEKIKSLKSAVIVMESKFNGATIRLRDLVDQANEKYLQEVVFMGNVASKTVLADGRATVSAMGQSRPVPEQMLKNLKARTYVVPEAHYREWGYTMEYKGTQKINKEEAHRILVKTPSGMEMTEYYSVKTGLKLRSVSSAAGEFNYSNYKAVDGVLWPMNVSLQNPNMPFTLEADVVSVLFNQELDPADFR